jgi:hypothetical protein
MAFTFDVKFTGQGTIVRRLPGTWAKLSEAAGRSLYQEGLAVLQLARLLAPIKTGFLRRSGYATRVPLAKGGHTVLVGFRAPYALVVHETHATRSKYLEQAYRMLANGMKQRMEAAIRREVR